MNAAYALLWIEINASGYFVASHLWTEIDTFRFLVAPCALNGIGVPGFFAAQLLTIWIPSIDYGWYFCIIQFVPSLHYCVTSVIWDQCFWHCGCITAIDWDWPFQLLCCITFNNWDQRFWLLVCITSIAIRFGASGFFAASTGIGASGFIVASLPP